MQDQSNTQLPLPEEEWRPVVGYEGWYEVSNLGRVRRIRPAPGATPGKILKPALKGRPTAYLSITLSRGDISQERKIHRLVTEAFWGSCPPGHQANHRDGNKLNNAATNLEWITASQNIRHAYRSGLCRAVLGEANGIAKLTESAVREIRALAGHVTQRRLAERYKVSPSVIHRAQRGETWKHL